MATLKLKSQSAPANRVTAPTPAAPPQTKPSNRGDIRRLATGVRATLVRRFPLTFAPKKTIKTPLKIGIDKDIQAVCPDMQRFHISVALRDYCSGPSYLVAITEGAARVDLSGLPSGEVTAQEAVQAIAKLNAASPDVWDRIERYPAPAERGLHMRPDGPTKEQPGSER